MHDKLKARSKGQRVLLSADHAKARKYRSSYQWQKLSKLILLRNPLCCDPYGTHEEGSDIVAGKEVHHIKAVATHYYLRAHRSNLASICSACHNKVSMSERDGTYNPDLFGKI